MDDSAPQTTTSETAPAARSNEFERYGLLAALTLAGLCFLLVDRWTPEPAAAGLPPADRLLRVRLGGNVPERVVYVPRPVPLRGTTAPTIRGAVQGPISKGAPVLQPALQPVPQPVPQTAPTTPATPRSCVVKSGDTLSDIARRELGSPRRAVEIAQLNGIADPAKLRLGQTLRLPPR